ncbi:MAG: alpha/beta hydrolase [Clostridiaceae bacterium]|nr:alpha/beta hydrolase [Clostridiaceae bacterium]
MKSEKIKLYEGRDDVTLTTYLLDDSPRAGKDGKRGAVLVCPGGAYLFCSDREGEPVAMAFANMGYQVFVLRYSVFFAGKPTELVPGREYPVNPDSVFPAPMRDIGRAMLMIKEHADEWAVDADKVAICGFSAGGHNCAMYSVYWNHPIMTDYFGVAAEQLRPAAAILGYPLTDYVAMKANVQADPEAGGLFGLANTAFLGTAEPDDELLAQASPARLVGQQTPPTFIWSTAADALVPIEQSTLYANALAANKIPFEIHVFEDGPHGLSTATQSSAEDRQQLDQDARKWLPLCDAWLYKRFAFEYDS